MYRCKRWSINSMNETLMNIIKNVGIYRIRNFRICGRHFDDSMYTNIDRLI